MTSIIIPSTANGQPKRARLRRQTMSLPVHTNGEAEKYTQRLSWTTAYYVRLPWPLSSRFGTRHVTIHLPFPQRFTNYLVRLDRSRPRLRKFVLASIFALGCYIFYVIFIYGRTRLVFSHDELRRIWEWEVESGHYQSSRNIPNKMVLNGPLWNPGIPASESRNSPSRSTIGAGLPRRYLNMQSSSSNLAYPPRPEAGSIADLDIIMDHCDFSDKKYVRDCLEFLKVGAGLDNGRRIRRGSIDDWKYIYVEDGQRPTIPNYHSSEVAAVSKQTINSLEPPLRLPPPRSYWTSSDLASACDREHPRIFHIFWGGPFTSHPYTMVLSYLYTQNLELHLPSGSPDRRACRPEFWIWIQTGPAREANPKPNAVELMYEELKSNPWSSPFLHPRFKDIIKFKLWNTTEQLDNISELKDEWRSLNLFKSGKRVFHVPSEERNSSSRWSWMNANDVMDRMTSTSSKSYDRMRTILSDLARFVLCHRYGGIYLDADTMFLRDWEELWGWKGAFAYRWSRLHKYNTAVLKLNKGSALGSFLIRTALRHDLDFHPMDGITRYIKDAQMEDLLLRLPDALFDSAWLNTEGYQRDRPPSPDFKSFENFFETPAKISGFVQSVGFDGFFRGAYSYHWHNNWWLPFDIARNWPDLGNRFVEAERLGRLKALGSPSPDEGALIEAKLDWEDHIPEDKKDLDWATLMKRTFEAYIRGEQPNMYGEWLHW